VFPVRHGLDSYVLLGINLVFKGLTGNAENEGSLQTTQKLAQHQV
jgi:hypothetical protein